MSREKSAPGSNRPLSRRRLTADEEHLWSLIARTVRPLRQGKKAVAITRQNAAAASEPVRLAKKKAPVEQPPTAPRSSPVPAPPPTSIVRRDLRQLARGRTAIEARIDLHGMTQAQAHAALLGFLRRSQAGGVKFVLVITGKGAPHTPRGERGVLRQQVPLWLSLPEFRSCVLGFDVAHVGHGGEGALYVRLRKARA
jgi:DNA-nicking Smr family endonuclease